MLDDVVHADGAVGVLLPPGASTPTPSSPRAAAPSASRCVVTRAEGNVIYELAGEPALERLMELAAVAQRRRPGSARPTALHLGVVVDEHQGRLRAGATSSSATSSAPTVTTARVAVGDEVEVGATVQFQVRDADSADEDLRRAARRPRRATAPSCSPATAGAPTSSARPDHDAEVVSDRVGSGAVAGMFCAGEFGPVGDRTFVHGFTASVLLFTAERRQARS